MSSSLDFGAVCMVGPRPIEETFGYLTLHFQPGWTGVVGPHRSGRSTLLRLAAGTVQPARGRVRIPGPAVYCGRDLGAPPARLEELLTTPDRLAAQLVGRLDLRRDVLLERWAAAGPGMRRRAQIACALWAEPAVLALDEPTADLDRVTQDLLVSLLARFRGIGLITSSDRVLLDRLCSACLLLGHGTPVLRKGTYAEAKALYLREQEILWRQKQNAERDLAALSATVEERRQEAQQANLRRSKRNLDPRDHDARQKLDRARKSGKDSKAGQLLKQLSGRLSQAQERVEGIPVEERPALPEQLAGEPAEAETLLHLSALGLERDTAIGRADRIGVASGSRKAVEQFCKRVVSALQAKALRVMHVPGDAEALADQLEAVWPGMEQKEQREAREIAAYLGYAVPEAIAVAELYEDELWKLVFAAGLARTRAGAPNLVLLEYPEHLLDLPSLERLEEVLGRCASAVVIASSDERLLAGTVRKRWEIAEEGNSMAVREG